MRLGVNIDHVATLRNARGGVHPSVMRAAQVVQQCGADLIVVHLREDRRHIREEDINIITENINIPLQLEIAPNKGMFNYSIENNIQKVCVVPENRRELTTEGGLNIKKNDLFLKNNLKTLFKNNIEVSLFIDPDLDIIKRAQDLGVEAIELHTGQYANATLDYEQNYLDKIIEATNYAINNGMSVRAGHGLNFNKVKNLLNIRGIEELNIGHFIIGEAIFSGLDRVIKNMLELIKNR